MGEMLSEKIMKFVGSLRNEQLLGHIDYLQNIITQNIKTHLPDLYRQANYYLTLGDPRSKEFPLMNPFHVMLITFAYLFVVFLGIILMKFIRMSRFNFLTKPLQFFYNMFLVVMSFWIGAEACYQAFAINNYGFVGNPINPSDPKQIGIARVMWAFYASKVIEMADTLFMVLRGSSRQISFLHVFHHSTIFFIWWFVIYYGPGGDAIYSIIINSFIHVVMYFYYMCATVGISLGPVKNLITIIQMFQFVWLMVHSSIYLYQDRQESPRFLVWTLIIYSFVLLLLFLNFYRQSGRDQKKEKD